MSESLPPLTEDDIRSLASAQSFERGVDYYRGGALFNARQIGNELQGYCQGSEYTPYRVSARLGPGGVLTTYCNCPYDWGGICKHRVALLLTYVHTPDAFQPVAPVDERLVGMSKEALIAIIQEMLRREPDLERLLDLPLQPDLEAPLDLSPFRRQLDFILRDTLYDPERIAFEIATIAETADRYASVESWSAAGAIYQLILSEIVPFYDQFYDEDGDIAMVLGQCAEGLERCIVEGEPDTATHQKWLEVLLEAELKDIQMGGIDLAYPARQVLLEQANDEEWRWIEKRVRERIASLSDQFSVWERESLVNLLVERQTSSGREAEVTDLILELGSGKQKAFELLRQGRLDEALSVAKEHFVDFPGLVLPFADALVEAGALDEAVAYITSQLKTGDRASYLAWLAQFAEENQDPEIVLKWRLSLFNESPNLNNYQNLREIAQKFERWGSMRPDLIRNLEKHQKWGLLIEIALEEGDVLRALELLPLQPWSYDLKVAQAAETDQPQAAIEIYRRRVEALIERRRRGNYQEAAAILQRVKELYHHQGDPAGWNRLMTGLRQRHARLSALMDELNKAGL
jgi:uncharacterized Zn finger protein